MSEVCICRFSVVLNLNVCRIRAVAKESDSRRAKVELPPLGSCSYRVSLNRHFSFTTARLASLHL
jgi:hypothetical protein